MQILTSTILFKRKKTVNSEILKKLYISVYFLVMFANVMRVEAFSCVASLVLLFVCFFSKEFYYAGFEMELL